MATISELRQRSRISRELQERKADKVREVVTNVVSSSAFTLTAANHMGIGNDSEEVKSKVAALANKVADEVTKVVTDPTIEFIEACKARGLKPTKIRVAVQQVSDLFDLEPNGTYADKLEAVAIYMSQNPKLYDDIALLK